MLMSKEDRKAIYSYLLNEGVCVAKKDLQMPKHRDIGVPNLYVVKTMQSLKSRNYVKEQFAWRHYYWMLTNEGMNYLRDYLHVPPEVVPATLKTQRRATDVRTGAMAESAAGAAGKMDDDTRDAYRKDFDKAAEAGVGVGQMDMRGGFGRGRMP